MTQVHVEVEAGISGIPDSLETRRRYPSEPVRRFVPDRVLAVDGVGEADPWSYYYNGPVVTKSGARHGQGLRGSLAVDRADLPPWVLEQIGLEVESRVTWARAEADSFARSWALEAARP